MFDSEMSSKGESLSRRSFLVGTAAAPIGLASGASGQTTSTPAPAPDPRVETVPPGETFEVRLGDNDTLGGDRGLLIDITAEGAAYDINARGSSWEIRNVAIIGSLNGTRTGTRLSAQVPDPDGKAVIDNLWITADNQSQPDERGGEAVGIFVHPRHAGTLLIRRTYLENYRNNGIYASSPGNPLSEELPGQGGTVSIENCYALNCSNAGFRIGTPESSVTDSVIVQTRPLDTSLDSDSEPDAVRAIWLYYGTGQLRDIAFSMSNGTGIDIGDPGRYQPTVVLENILGEASDGVLTGFTRLIRGEYSIEEPSRAQLTPPPGCPSTPQAVFEQRVPHLEGIGTGRPNIGPIGLGDAIAQLVRMLSVRLVGIVLSIIAAIVAIDAWFKRERD
jgi:hypothetical protein